MNDFYAMLEARDLDLLTYIRDRATESCQESSFGHGQSCENNYFLRFWNRNKQQNPLIADMFAEKLILTKRVYFKESDDELYQRVREILTSDDYYTFRQEVLHYLRMYNKESWTECNILWKDHINYGAEWVWSNPHINCENPEDECCMWSLKNIMEIFFSNEDNFIKNIYSGPTCTFFISKDKRFTLNNNAKMSKALVKVANVVINYLHDSDASDVRIENTKERIESFRVEFSTVRNQATFNTPMCLSIHPLDYLTASENSNGWRSCMNIWDGEYRRGVIEMMNSPYVIVAYTPSEHDDLYVANGKYWNSKKWREFFIVHPTYGVFGIKGYPYWNPSLETEALSWIRSLLGEEQYTAPQTYHLDDSCCDDTTGEVIFKAPNFNCGPAMYNDFYGSNEYQCIVNKAMEPTNEWLDIHYSGESICMVCGERGEFDNESSVCCYDCYEVHICCVCGESINNEEDLYEHCGREYCYSCYSNLPHCDICDDVYDPDSEDGFEGTEIGIGFADEYRGYLTEKRYVLADARQQARAVCTCASCLNEYVKNPEEAISEAPHHTEWWQYVPLIAPVRFRSFEHYKDFIKAVDSSLVPSATSLYIRNKKRVEQEAERRRQRVEVINQKLYEVKKLEDIGFVLPSDKADTPVYIAMGMA